MLTWNDYGSWLGDVLKGPLPKGSAPALQAWVTDTRTIRSGQWFVPISGANFDGHKFLAEAVEKGAEGFFYTASRAAEVPEAIRARGIAVTEPLEAFQRIAAGWRTTLKQLRLVALTGSTGKTTTKEMLSAIFRAAGPTFSTHASFNNEVGVPKTLQQLTTEHRYAAVEFGARMPGNIKFLCEMARPNVAALLNVGVTHVGVFGSPENLLHTKLEIFRDSPADCLLVANADDARIADAARATGKKVTTFGSHRNADVRLIGAEWRADGMGVHLSVAGRTVSVQLGVAHEAYPINAAAAAAMAHVAGVSAGAIEEGLQGFTGIKGRYQVHRRGAVTIIDDTYNANPDSMIAGLTTLMRSFGQARKVVVLGDMLELGPISQEEHRKVGAFCAQSVHPQLLLTVGTDARCIAEAARAQGLAADAVRSYADVEGLLAGERDLTANADVVYAKGSNGIRLSLLVEKLTAAGAAR
jgi:UDP-N-acetylmuramoyl-tripeptide--D-alanyl-D-alanine ligase